jgi:hypothetical protein
VQLNVQLVANKEQSTLLRQQLSQTTSTLEASERDIEKLTSDLTASKQLAKNFKSLVRVLLTRS